MHPHHARFLVGSIIGILAGLFVAGGGFWAYEYFWARFAPTVITKDASEIQRLLDQGDWVSPGRKGAPIYLLTYRDCDACAAYQSQEFPKLAAADVDTRVPVFVRPDASGQPLSTPAERATVAEIWFNRDWSLYDRWMATPVDNWAPQGLHPADGDWARTAVVASTHAYVDRIRALLHENGVTGDDPILIWRDKKGRLKACSCTDRLSYHFVRSDFGAPNQAPPPAASGAPAGSGPAASSPSSAPGPAMLSSSAPADASAPSPVTPHPNPAQKKPLAQGGGSPDNTFY